MGVAGLVLGAAGAAGFQGCWQVCRIFGLRGVDEIETLGPFFRASGVRRGGVLAVDMSSLMGFRNL